MHPHWAREIPGGMPGRPRSSIQQRAVSWNSPVFWGKPAIRFGNPPDKQDAPEETTVKRILGSAEDRSSLIPVKTILFRLTAGIAGVYHLLLGAAFLVLPAEKLSGTAKGFLGVGIEFDAKLAMVGKFASAYILAFGVMLMLLCWKPVKLRALVIPVLLLFGVRLVNKLVFLTSIEGTFGVDRGRSLFAIASLALIFAVMAWARPASDPSQGS